MPNNQPTNHITEAERWLKAADSIRAGQDASHQLSAALAHATLAIAKELRTANLLTLGTTPTELGKHTAATYRDAAIERL